MKLKSQIKSVFVQPLSCITLSIITTISIAPLALAIASKTSPIQFTTEKQQPQKLAQFSDTEQTERSQLLQQANSLYNQGDLKAAEESFRKFIQKFPEDAFGHFQLGNILFSQKKSEPAVSAYREAIRIRAQYALAYNAIGIVYASDSRWEDAIVEYQKALEINPNYGEALTNLALVLWQTNKRDNAVSSLEKALAIFKSQNRNEKVNQVEKILQQIKNSDEPNVS
ncbi:MAG: tetratricopeptide repeat protein [Goleter apudmare HA4340-LM2]|jgi:tetratricopeptide (TPR) repeat protein|nr:tetratricopeptide repeat protein [Goleter apudmare HA4340-LM2]